MRASSPPALHAGTPDLMALETRGLPVRELQCYRGGADDAVDLRITRHSHGPRGQLIKSLDPRLASTSPNFRWQHDLAGQPLRTDSVDAGVTLALTDVAGRSLLAISATGVRQTSTYEDSALPGRLQAVLEQAPGEAASLVTDRFCWAGQSQAEKDLNLSGQCVRHYDTAGLNQLQRASVNGAVLAQSRQLLAGEQAADWAGDSEQGWQAALDAEAFVTQRTVDATGAQLTQTDACGHVQRLAYDLTGQLRGSWLTLQGQTEQVIVASLRYSAMGQKVQEVHGNGVVTDYDYEPRTQQLIGIRVQRPANAGSAARVLQDLRYTYDPVGNVLNVRNDAEATRFWRNQKVVPEQVFAYDSLYQLMQATGREMANRGQQGSQLPAALTPLPSNDDAYTPYTRTYRYDRAGNLTHIQHSAPASNNNYTTQLTVSNRSNRAVLAQDGLLPEHVDAQFDEGGHQLALLLGQHLRWSTRGELAQVTPILREGQPDDREWYRYGSDGMRLLKVSELVAASSTQAQRVLYLEGLEVRSSYVGETLSERLEVIIVAAGGEAAVRVLHWASGVPTELRNDQIRYSYHNLIGSIGLDLDAQGELISLEEYFPFGGTAVWAVRSQIEVDYKFVRYSGKERDVSGLYYYGYRYYQPWGARWLSADPGGTVDGLNLFRMVRNNPLALYDPDGLSPDRVQKKAYMYAPFVGGDALVQIVSGSYGRAGAVVSAVVKNAKAKNKLEAKIKAELKGSLSNKEYFKKRVAVMEASHLGDETRAKLLQMTEAMTHYTKMAAVLTHLDVIDNSKEKLLSKLRPGQHKLYVVGHGGAGRDVLAETQEGKKTITVDKLVEQFVKGGLSLDFDDVRIIGCYSADSVVINTFDEAELARAVKGQRGGRGAFAALVSDAFKKRNYINMVVTGYHGLGWSYPGEHHERRVTKESSPVRRSTVRHRF